MEGPARAALVAAAGCDGVQRHDFHQSVTETVGESSREGCLARWIKTSRELDSQKERRERCAERRGEAAQRCTSHTCFRREHTRSHTRNRRF